MNKSKYIKTEILKAAREANKYTYEDMANLMGYRSKTTYMYIENGQTIPNLPQMLKISQIFSKPVEYFFNLNVQDTQTYDGIQASTGTDD